MTSTIAILNYIASQWQPSKATQFADVVNPATGELMGRTPLSSKDEVDQAAQAAAEALPGWCPDRQVH